MNDPQDNAATARESANPREIGGARPAPPRSKIDRAAVTDSELAGLERLRAMLDGDRRAKAGWSDQQILELPQLYSLAISVLARLQAEGLRPRVSGEVRRLVDLAQVELFRNRELVSQNRPRGWAGAVTGLREALLVRGPRALRQEWRLLAASIGVLYGLALVAWFAVSRDLDLAYSLLDPGVVDSEIEQLNAIADGGSFRGNFTFGLGESPANAVWIMLHNMGVGVMFFGAALIPPLYLLILSQNALMLGTYTAIAGHWGQAGAISSILWCHGVLEIQALGLAGTAGLVLVRALLFPGVFSRPTALLRAGRLAVDMLLPVFALLFLAGLIEGFISPHASAPVRIAVAICSGVLLIAWALFCGRGETSTDSERMPRASTG